MYFVTQGTPSQSRQAYVKIVCYSHTNSCFIYRVSILRIGIASIQLCLIPFKLRTIQYCIPPSFGIGYTKFCKLRVEATGVRPVATNNIFFSVTDNKA
jgi:hypothetical protein